MEEVQDERQKRSMISLRLRGKENVAGGRRGARERKGRNRWSGKKKGRERRR